MIRFTKSIEVIPMSVSSAQGSLEKEQNDEIIKVESQEPMEPWKNTQLLEHVRESGKRAETALKVEDIEALSELPFMKPPANYVQSNIESIRSS